MIYNHNITEGWENRLVDSTGRGVAEARESGREEERVMGGADRGDEEEMRDGDEVEGGYKLVVLVQRVESAEDCACRISATNPNSKHDATHRCLHKPIAVLHTN